MNKFPKGARVIKTVGCRMEGTVIAPLVQLENTHTRFQSPDMVWVHWEDGSKGGVVAENLMPLPIA